MQDLIFHCCEPHIFIYTYQIIKVALTPTLMVVNDYTRCTVVQDRVLYMCVYLCIYNMECMYHYGCSNEIECAEVSVADSMHCNGNFSSLYHRNSRQLFCAVLVIHAYRKSFSVLFNYDWLTPHHIICLNILFLRENSSPLFPQSLAFHTNGEESTKLF